MLAKKDGPLVGGVRLGRGGLANASCFLSGLGNSSTTGRGPKNENKNKKRKEKRETRKYCRGTGKEIATSNQGGGKGRSLPWRLTSFPPLRIALRRRPPRHCQDDPMPKPKPQIENSEGRPICWNTSDKTKKRVKTVGQCNNTRPKTRGNPRASAGKDNTTHSSPLSSGRSAA